LLDKAAFGRLDLSKAIISLISIYLSSSLVTAYMFRVGTRGIEFIEMH
jgi:hypothetical protein